MSQVPGWFLFHVPHDSTWIPENVRQQFVLQDDELAIELLKMTDHHTLDLYTAGVPEHQIVRAKVSRLVVDVERFADDSEEEMAKIGMGVVYARSHTSSLLRRPLTDSERRSLLSDWYLPHHEILTIKVANILERFGKCLIVDCHSFASQPLPHEPDQAPKRPAICIGTDPFHTPSSLADSLVDAFVGEGFSCKVNSPFAGALVPLKFYKKDQRVRSVMIETRRNLYMDEATGEKSGQFDEIAQSIRSSILKCSAAL